MQVGLLGGFPPHTIRAAVAALPALSFLACIPVYVAPHSASNEALVVAAAAAARRFATSRRVMRLVCGGQLLDPFAVPAADP